MKALLSLLLVSCFALTSFGGVKETESAGAEFSIVSASYGFEDERIDVAGLLRPLVQHGVLLLRGTWDFGNPDPKPGTVKDVVIVYRFNGEEATATFRQRQDIILPPPAKGLTILHATYGFANSHVDVTEAVRAAVSNDSLQVEPGWGFGRVDPAFGKVKSVEITYCHDGALETVVFSQHQRIELP